MCNKSPSDDRPSYPHHHPCSENKQPFSIIVTLGIGVCVCVRLCACEQRAYRSISLWKPVPTDRNWQPLKPCFGSQGLRGSAASRCTQLARAALAIFRRQTPGWRSYEFIGDVSHPNSSPTSSLCVKTNCRHRSGGVGGGCNYFQG